MQFFIYIKLRKIKFNKTVLSKFLNNPIDNEYQNQSLKSLVLSILNDEPASYERNTKNTDIKSKSQSKIKSENLHIKDQSLSVLIKSK